MPPSKGSLSNIEIAQQAKMKPIVPLAKERLSVLRGTNDGFEVARRDLELRGPGELLGTRQAGLMQLKVADLMRDADLLPVAQIYQAFAFDAETWGVAESDFALTLRQYSNKEKS